MTPDTVVVSLFIRSRLLLPLSWCGVVFVLLFFFIFSNDFERSYMLYARGLPLFISSALAVTLWKSPKGRQWIINIAKARLLPISVLLVTIAAFIAGTGDLFKESSIRYVFAPLLSCGFALLIVRVSCPGYKCPLWLEHKWLVQIGKVSYGIYLYHILIRDGVWKYTDSLVVNLPAYQAYGARLLLFFTLTFILALISYRLIEKPFLRIKSRCRE